MQIIDGRKIRDDILQTLRDRVRALPIVPKFCDVLVGEDAASMQYVRMKERTAESIGITVEKAAYPESITTEELIKEIERISNITNMAGLIIQLPLPSHIDQKKVLDSVPEEIDVDATSTNMSDRFYGGLPSFVPPSAAAVMAVIDSLDVSLAEKNIVLVGNGLLVNRPVSHILKTRGLTPVIITEVTPNKENIFESADMLISATGKAGLIKGDTLKENAIIIDAGTSESGAGVAGDVDMQTLGNFAGIISPVPGGVGPVTVAMLMQNVVISAEQKSK